MQPTRRYWEYVALAGSLGGAAFLFDRPLLLVGMAGLLAWLFAAQVAFLRALFAFDRTLAVEHRLSTPTTLVEEPVSLVFGFDGNTQRLSVTATADPPPGVAVDELPSIESGETATTTVTGQLVGEHTFGPPELTVRGAGGLFTETYTRGPTRELVVEAREPGRVHIGTGGDAVSSPVGAHTAGSGASGLVPAELREYVEDDPASRIDWNATARLASAHVREFDAEAELTTLFVIDRRERLDIGPPGETAFETLRASALYYLAITESLDDPVRCFGVTDTEIDRLAGGADGTRTYDAVRRRIRALTVDDVSGSAGSVERPQALAQRSPTLDPTTPFGRTLRPFLRGGTAVRTADPLVAAVRNGLATQRHGTQLALFTDDSDRTEIRNAVTEARRTNSRVAVFLAPRVLYEPGELDDPTATERYRSFEEFRQLLHSIPDVTAYEVAPQARIDRLLETTARVQQQTNT